MQYLNVINVAIGVVTFLIGSVGSSFIAKFFLKKYIKDNDLKHTEWRKSIQEIKLSLVAIASKVDLIKEIRDDLRDHNKSISLLNSRLNRIEGESFYQRR